MAEESFKPHQERHINAGHLLKSIIYGGLDGSVNSLVIILTAIASQTSSLRIAAFCAAAVVGDGLGMGLGDFLSARAEIEYAKSEEERERYEIQHMLQAEKQEMIQIYRQKGFEIKDCARIAELIATNQQAFIGIMMLSELKLVVMDQEVALRCGIATFISFVLFGALPALPFFLSLTHSVASRAQLLAVLVIGLTELFSLGATKAVLIGLSSLRSGLETLVIGSVVTGLGYGLGVLFGS